MVIRTTYPNPWQPSPFRPSPAGRRNIPRGSGEGGPDPTRIGTITVLVNPPGQILIGQQVTFTAVRTNGGAPMTYQWYYDPGNVLIPGATGSSYTFTPTSTTNSGTYKVVVSSPGAVDTPQSGQAAITVQDPLYVTAGKAPAFDLTFSSGGAQELGGRLGTFTRASTKLCWDGTQFVTRAINVIPLSFDPATGKWGALLEAAATNLFLNTATPATQGIAVTAQQYTLSFYGTGTITLSGASTAGPLVGTGVAPNRVSLTFTPAAGALTLTVSGTIAFPQLETGPTATSPIVTTGAAATRATDAWNYLGVPFTSWWDASGMMSYAEFSSPIPPASTSYGVWGVDNNTFGRGWCVNLQATPAIRLSYRDATTNTFISSPMSAGLNKVSAYANTATRSESANGSVVSSNSTALTLAPAIDRMKIGTNNIAGTNPTGPFLLTRLAFWPYTEAEALARLQQLSQL
jgi:hypothetical protein